MKKKSTINAPISTPRAERWTGNGLLETLDLLFEPAYLSILLLYKLAKIRVLRLEGVYLRIRRDQLLAKHGRQRNLFKDVGDESHNCGGVKWPNDQKLSHGGCVDKASDNQQPRSAK